MRLSVALIAPILALVAACAPVEPPRLGPDGRPLPKLYRIGEQDAGEVQYRMLDAVIVAGASNSVTYIPAISSHTMPP